MEIRIFSGMGNSLAVGRRLQQLLASDASDDLLWVFPVYAWGIPPVVASHLKTQDLSGRRCHMVCTYGDEAGHIDRQWRSLVESRSGICGGIYGVQMPNTYVCLPGFDTDPAEIARRKLDGAESQINRIAGSLLSGNFKPDIHIGSMPWLKTMVIYPLFFKFLMKSRKFHHSAGCTACGLCIRQCPTANIKADSDGAPVWGNNCAYCLRCYHACPHHAVRYGKQTTHKRQYLHPDFYK